MIIMESMHAWFAKIKYRVFRRKCIVKMLIGALIGGVLGFLYYKLVGCPNGACPITSKPLNSILYGAVMGLMVTSM